MPKIVKIDMALNIVVQADGLKKLLKAADAIEAAELYLAATEAKFGGIEWVYDGIHRRSDRVIAVLFKQKKWQKLTRR